MTGLSLYCQEGLLSSSLINLADIQVERSIARRRAGWLSVFILTILEPMEKPRCFELSSLYPGKTKVSLFLPLLASNNIEASALRQATGPAVHVFSDLVKVKFAEYEALP